MVQLNNDIHGMPAGPVTKTWMVFVNDDGCLAAYSVYTGQLVL